jgi:hypothetical protein
MVKLLRTVVGDTLENFVGNLAHVFEDPLPGRHGLGSGPFGLIRLSFLIALLKQSQRLVQHGGFGGVPAALNSGANERYPIFLHMNCHDRVSFRPPALQADDSSLGFAEIGFKSALELHDPSRFR